MTIGGEAIWDWLKKAPLPVVLSLCLTTSGLLATWLYAVDKEQSEQKAAVAVAAEQSKAAAETTKRLEDKVDKLLEIVIAQKAIQDEKDKASKAKKEKQ